MIRCFVKTVFVVFITLSLAACNDAIDKVKSGKLAFDTTTTIGQALDGYSLAKEKQWSTYQDNQGRTYVKYVARLDIGTMAGHIEKALQKTQYDSYLGRDFIDQLIHDSIVNDKYLINNVNYVVVFTTSDNAINVSDSYLSFPEKMFSSKDLQGIVGLSGLGLMETGMRYLPEEDAVQVRGRDVLEHVVIIYRDQAASVFPILYASFLKEKLAEEFKLVIERKKEDVERARQSREDESRTEAMRGAAVLGKQKDELIGVYVSPGQGKYRSAEEVIIYRIDSVDVVGGDVVAKGGYRILSSMSHIGEQSRNESLPLYLKRAGQDGSILVFYGGPFENMKSDEPRFYFMGDGVDPDSVFDRAPQGHVLRRIKGSDLDPEYAEFVSPILAAMEKTPAKPEKIDVWEGTVSLRLSERIAEIANDDGEALYFSSQTQQGMQLLARCPADLRCKLEGVSTYREVIVNFANATKLIPVFSDMSEKWWLRKIVKDGKDTLLSVCIEETDDCGFLRLVEGNNPAFTTYAYNQHRFVQGLVFTATVNNQGEVTQLSLQPRPSNSGEVRRLR